MSTQDGLTQVEKRLLERYHDGALAGAELKRAERLMGSASVARDYLTSLREVKLCVKGAEEALWEAVCEAGGLGVVEASMISPSSSFMEESLDELMPLLERYHDGVVHDGEREDVEHLIEAREDVAGYLGGLAEIGLGVQGATERALEEVDFNGFWGALNARLEGEGVHVEEELDNVISFPPKSAPKATRERPAFEVDDHRVLLYRYHDGEATGEERAQVEAWAEIDEDVSSTLLALEELRFAASASMELAEEHIEPGLLWSMIEGRVAQRAPQESRVTSLGAYREVKEAAASAATPESNHRRELFIALAAMLCTVVGVAIFQDSLFPSEQVIVEKTVVIVDSLEYGEGTSVMVTGAMQSASMERGGDVEPVGDGDVALDEEGDEEVTPTVIWLIDPEQPSTPNEGATEPKGRAPKMDGGKPI